MRPRARRSERVPHSRSRTGFGACIPRVDAELGAAATGLDGDFPEAHGAEHEFVEPGLSMKELSGLGEAFGFGRRPRAECACRAATSFVFVAAEELFDLLLVHRVEIVRHGELARA